MESLIRKSINRINSVSDNFYRYMIDQIHWDDKLTCIVGARGAGKTTMILQHIKQNYKADNTCLYISLDDIFFTERKLSDIVEDFYNRGGRYLFVDEIHKYPNWSIEVKNIYDTYLDLKVVLSGSSMLDIDYGKADLSRRLSIYSLSNLSFREFIQYEYGIKLPAFGLNDILQRHVEIATDITSKISPLAYFAKYLQYGCFPFYKESEQKYYQRLNNIINVTLETDIPSVVSVDFAHMQKLKQIMYIVSQSAPFKPNVVKLSEKTGIDRRTVIRYFDLLQRAGLINMLIDSTKGIAQLAKPDKIYLDNTNLIYALAEGASNIGNIRETFFLNQLSAVSKVNYAKQGDFTVQQQYVFEIGGKNKGFEQIKDIPGSFLALDDIAVGYGNKIPLWLFGFLY